MKYRSFPFLVAAALAVASACGGDSDREATKTTSGAEGAATQPTASAVDIDGVQPADPAEVAVVEEPSVAQEQVGGSEDDRCGAGERLFTHPQLASDEVCIPIDPQRIVTLERLSFETLQALDVTPIATLTGYIDNYQLDFPYRDGDVEGIIDIGPLGSVNSELLAGAQPDLIIGDIGRTSEFYDDLSTIAPTILYDFTHSGEWRDVARFTAAAVGRSEDLEVIDLDYEERATALGDAFDGDPADVDVSVIRVNEDSVRLYAKDSFLGSVLAVVGLGRPDSQDLTDSELQDQFGASTFYTISPELLPSADGDVIFIWTTGSTEKIAAGAEENLEELRTNPLWETLTAVQADAVFQVGGYWIGSSYLAAHEMLDDLATDLDVANADSVPRNPFKN